jgi:basic membrane protein A
VRRYLASGFVIAAMLLASCGSEPAGSAAPAKKIGLVTDVGQLADKSFNASAYKGLKNAESNLKVKVDVIESKQDTDYEKNIQSFITQGYDMVVTVGFLMGDATLKLARANPKTKFAIVDYEYFPDPKIENNAEPYTTYAKNVTSLIFREDQAGYLVGALAGSMTKSNVVGAVYGLAVPAVCKYRDGYEHGAKWANPAARTLGVYQPFSGPKTFNDPDWGKARGLEFIGQGADVIFGAGGRTGNGGLLAAKDANKPDKPVYAIGVDQDQYESFPEVRSVLLSSAVKRVDVSVFNAIKTFTDGKFKGGKLLFDLSNDGVGAAPFHDLEAKVPQTAKDKLAAATKALKEKSVDTGYDASKCK